MFIKNLFTYIKHRRIINKVLESEHIIEKLNGIFNVRFKIDWIGRIYCVINPITMSDINERIFEMDESGKNFNAFVNNWVMKRMTIVDSFVKNHELFDILVYEIKQLDENYNYLITLTPIAWFDFWNSSKRLLWTLFGLIIVSGIGFTLFEILK